MTDHALFRASRMAAGLDPEPSYFHTNPPKNINMSDEARHKKLAADAEAQRKWALSEMKRMKEEKKKNRKQNTLSAGGSVRRQSTPRTHPQQSFVGQPNGTRSQQSGVTYPQQSFSADGFLRTAPQRSAGQHNGIHQQQPGSGITYSGGINQTLTGYAATAASTEDFKNSDSKYGAQEKPSVMSVQLDSSELIAHLHERIADLASQLEQAGIVISGLQKQNAESKEKYVSLLQELCYERKITSELFMVRSADEKRIRELESSNGISGNSLESDNEFEQSVNLQQNSQMEQMQKSLQQPFGSIAEQPAGTHSRQRIIEQSSETHSQQNAGQSVAVSVHPQQNSPIRTLGVTNDNAEQSVSAAGAAGAGTDSQAVKN